MSNATTSDSVQPQSATHSKGIGQPANRLIFLEYLRTYAFLNVVGTHVFQDYLHIDLSGHANAVLVGLGRLYNAIAPTFFGGATGVIVFFLVSGYIIFSVSEREAPLTFAVRRIFRIYPLYILAVISQFAISDGHLPNWDSLRPRLSLLGDFTGTGNVLNGVDWTLRMEIVFYAFVFVMTLFNASAVAKKFKPYLLPLIVVICVAAPSFPHRPNTLNLYFPYFMVGAALYFYEQRRISLNFLILLTTAVLITSFGRGNALGLGLFFAAWVVRRKLKHSSVVIGLAGVSYAVYLLHAWLITYMVDKLQTVISSGIFRTLLALVILFAICYLLHFVVEKPFIAAGRTLSKSLSRLDVRFKSA